MSLLVTRRSFLLGGAVAVGAFPVLHSAEVRRETHTFKRVGNLEIKADIHRVVGEAAPRVVVWIHGGALINGHREGVSERVKRIVLDAGCALVSIDYRLAPETKLPAIIEDVQDAFQWLHAEGSRRLNLDTRKIAVMGGSAGGYLTLTAGYRVAPRPALLVSLWGYGDLIGDWYSKPSSHARHHRVQMSEKEARRQVSGPPISDSRHRKGDGGAFYQFCRQRGIWPQEVSTWDPHTQPEKFFPYMPVRNVSRDYPPTLLIHGTEDTDVPFEQSRMMADRLREYSVLHDLIAIPGGEHGLAGGDPKLIDEAYRRVETFLKRHMD